MFNKLLRKFRKKSDLKELSIKSAFHVDQLNVIDINGVCSAEVSSAPDSDFILDRLKFKAKQALYEELSNSDAIVYETKIINGITVVTASLKVLT